MKLKQISKRTLSIVLTVLMVFSTLFVGTISVDAYQSVKLLANLKYVYFDKTNATDWEYIKFMTAQKSYLSGVGLNHITNTNLYYTDVSSYSTWGLDCYGFLKCDTSTSEWGDQSISDSCEGWDHIMTYAAGYTTAIGTTQTNQYAYYTTAKNSSNSKLQDLTEHGISSYTGLNMNQTVTAQVAQSGSTTYSDPTTSPADISVSGMAFGSKDACNNSKSASLTAGGSTVTGTAAVGYTATTKMTVSNVASGYTFDGWYNSSGTQLKDGTNLTYEYSTTAAQTVYARFTQAPTTVSNISASAKHTDDGTTYTTGGGTVTIDGGTSAVASVGSEGVTVAAQDDYPGYKFAGWTSENGSFTDATALSTTFKPSADNAVAVAQYKKVYSITVNPSNNGSVAADKTPAEYLVGDSYTLTVTPVSQFKLKTLTVGGTDVTTSVSNKQYTGTITSDLTVEATFEESKDIVIYVACPSNWGQEGAWGQNGNVSNASTSDDDRIIGGMTVTTALNGTAAATGATVYGYTDSASTYIGIKNVNGKSVRVSKITLPGEAADWTKFYIGNKLGAYFYATAFSGAPQYGYCYYFYASGDNTYTGTCAATTVSAPTVNNATTASVDANDTSANTVSFSSTVTKPNSSTGSYTAGGTTYRVKYILKETTTGTEITVGGELETKDYTRTFTAAEAGTYTVTAVLYDDYTSFTSADTATLTVTAAPRYNVTLPTASSITGGKVETTATNYTEGTEVTITATPDPGYTFKSMTVNGEQYVPNANGLNVVTVDADGVASLTLKGTTDGISVTAVEFTQDTYTVSINEPVNGTATIDATSAVYGDTITVTATPADGYVLDTIKVNNVAIEGNTFQVTGDSAVVVTFKERQTQYRLIGLNSWPSGGGESHIYNNGISGSEFSNVSGTSIYYVKYSNTDTNNKWFRIIDGDNTEYGPKNETTIESLTYDSKYIAEQTYTPSYTGNWGDLKSFTLSSSNLYICIDSSNNQIWSQTTEPKLSDFVSTFTVTINNGSLSCNDDATSTMERGTSYLDGTKGLQSTQHTYDNLSVSFGTDVNKNNLLGYTAGSGYAYKVYGYSILMTYKDGSQGVTSVFGNSKITNNGNGNYTSSYTFPENIKSAEITPVYLLSDELQAARNVKYTTVYLRMKPGENELSNTYEPFYYTWRNLSQTYTDPEDPSTSYTLAKNPNGQWPGQVMLYLDQQETYFALVQGGIDGITFTSEENKLIQTFDFEEFIALQKLGYDHITFDMITSTATYGNTMHSTYASGKNKTYFNDANTTSAPDGYNSTFLSEAQLYTNLNGEYIDVFGNKLTDASGNAISRESVVSTLNTGYTLSDELAALYTAMGITDTTAQTWLGGARYGYYDYEKDNLYGMTYAVRVYYFNNTGAMVSQQISGTGTISGGKSPLSTTGQTNGAYAYSTDTITYNYKTSDDYNSSDKSNSLNGNNLKEYETGYELIPETYAGVPYLVTYAKENKLTLDDGDHYRYDGRWYYSAEAEKFTVDVKTSELADDGSLQKGADGNLAEITGVGTAYINTDGTTSLEVDQGGTVTFNAYSGNHTFAGWYTSDGKLVSKNAAYSVDNIANNYELFAVFQKIADGNIVVINEILTDDTLNIQPGYGSGTVTATLKVTDKDKGTVTEYGNGEAAPVTDGDTIQWVITATPTAPDYFKNFYSEETMDDGSRYLSKLDAADQLVLNPDGTSTYTSVATKWDWLTATGSSQPSTHTINLYSDFQKVSAYATLNYHYKDRFGDMKTYIVKDVLLTSAEVADGYKPDPTKVAKYAPYVGDLYKSFTWDCSTTGTSSEYGSNKYDKSVVDIYAVPTEETYVTFMGSYNTDGSVNLNAYNKDTNFYKANTSVSLNANPTSDGKNFSYWMMYQLNVDDTTKAVSLADNGEIFSYNKDITFRSTFNAVYIPVYGETVNPFTTNVQQAVYSREQSTEGDYVYADFLTQFETSVPGVLFKDAVANTSTSNPLTVGDKTITSIKFGLLTERDMNAAAYSGGTITAPSANSVQNIKDNVVNLYTTGQTSGWDKNSASGTAAYNYYYNLYDYTASAANLTEYGRMDFFFKFENTAENQGKVYNVYSYVYYTYSDGTTEVVLGTPSVLNIYAAGTKTLNSTSA